MDSEWPFRGYDGPQPWEADNTPELTTNHLMVSAGSAGPEVAELADLLSRLGYSTSISTGQNPTNTYDNTVADAVRQFGADFGVREDPKVLQARTDDTVGPWLWEALTRAVYKQANKEAGLS
jgi:peptidoglycan hydrolase-like protein with peptidoglycan-binding domain